MKHLALIVALIAGCYGSGGGGGTGGGGTGATCPATAPPTYDSFGHQFFQSYCTRCHSTTSTDRMGAPDDLNWDTQAGIDQHLADIEGQAAKGPNATNRLMPFTPPDPTDAERETLGQFLACEKLRAH